MPSTRGRSGIHPLQALVAPSLGLRQVSVIASQLYGADERSFRSDRFSLTKNERLSRPLLIDDTWTTGARIQSLAHALKRAGADSVVAVVLGRHVNPDFEPSKRLIARIRGKSFDMDHCVLED